MLDREKVFNGLRDIDMFIAGRLGHEKAKNFLRTIDETIALLKEQEAKTGTWIEKTDYMGDTYYDCSVCGESWTTIDGTPWQNGMNYCLHCGAKMEI